ncbi:unnamed protein product [Vicia faba]|uniref:Nucleolar pre-ribosomal-associated protein 1 n=1 Tax=Vicia faba TaxID=3906 RepID=A0AAV1BB64_VICFA|nr:unnamed protein product [Vicia faba]
MEQNSAAAYGGVISYEAKLKELLHRITSPEIKLCSDATKEFVKLLKSDNGAKLLRDYVLGSPKCSELLEAWKLRQGKQDKFARLIVTDYLNDLYKELNGKELKRQKAVLLLLASIVRRGAGIASEVAKSFDFKVAGFTALAKRTRKSEGKREVLLRKSFVGFAMSFLEVGKPGLLRWILQQREMYSGVLRGLENDDDETVVFVLSTLRDYVLVEASLVPPGLRSVLFGSVTLEQLVGICGREGGGDAAKIAFDVLVLVCTDPSNGLMPDSKKRPHPLKGNQKRMMDLLKKMWPTEVQYHRDLLLAIVNARPSFGLLYLKEFPHNVENYKSSSWIFAVSLAADLVSSISNGISKEFGNSRSNVSSSIDNIDLLDIVKCLFPRPFSRSMFNKGLHHANSFVKHGTLRLLLELLKLLDSLFGGLNHSSNSDNPLMQHMVSVKQEIQNYVQPYLPDLQVLLNLLSSLDTCYESNNSSLKRNASHHEHDGNSRKKLKMDTSESDIDIIVGGISSAPDIDLSGDTGTVDDALKEDAPDDAEDLKNSVGEVWGLDLHSIDISTLKDAESYLLSKLLDALRYYHRTLPSTLDHSFDSFKALLKNPLELTSHLQVSLLSLLVEFIQWCPENEIPIRTPAMLYKYLQPFTTLFMFSPIKKARNLAYRLAVAAMFSTGAFDGNFHEIHSWFLFLPGFQWEQSPVNILEVDVLHNLTLFVITFLCDAVSTIGNSLVKYWNILKNRIHSSEGDKDLSPDVSPFIICVLEKCLKVIRSKSGTCSLPKKSIVLSYTCNTVKYLLQTQVNAELLSSVVNADLTERLGDSYEYDEVFPEWKPLKNLLDFVEGISHQQNCCLLSGKEESVHPDGSLGSSLGDVNRLLGGGDDHRMAETTVALISSIACENTDKISMDLPSSVVISRDLLDVPFSLLSSIYFLDYSVLVHASKMWPVTFYAGLDMAISDLCSDSQNAAPIETSDLTFCPDSLTCGQLLDAFEPDSAAFSIILKQAPFHVIFPAMMCMNGHCASKLSKMQDLLLHKLCEFVNDHSLLPSLQLVLFWTHQIQQSHKVIPLAEIEQLLNICVVLVQNLLAKLLVPESSDLSIKDSAFSFSSHYVEEVIKTICCHPSVLISLSFSLGNSQNISNGNTGTDFDILNVLSSEGFKKFGNPILDILTMTLDNTWSLFSTHLCGSKAEDVTNNFVKIFKGLQQKLFLEVKKRFELCIGTKDTTPLLPTLYALHTLHRFLSPFQLLELVDWMFNRVGMDDLPTKMSFLSVGCSLASYAFSTLSFYFQQSSGNRVSYDLFWEMGESNVKADIFEQIYSKVVDFSVNHEIDCADSCLLEAVDALYKQKNMQQESFHPLMLVVWKIIMNTPVKMLSLCLYKMNAKRARFLHILTELSSLHSSIFGHLFLGIVKRSLDHDVGVAEAFDLSLSEDQFISLLPTSLSYLRLILKRFGDLSHRDFKKIPYFYSKILLKGFSQWKSFLSKDIFEEEYGESVPSSVQELLCLTDCSLLGKSIHMLQYHFALNGDSLKLKNRLKLFKSIWPTLALHDELMDCHSQCIDSYSLCQSFNIINHVVAKISLCKMLLFHDEEGGDLKEVALEMRSNLKASRIHFINVLVNIWQLIVQKFSLSSHQSGTGKSTSISLLYNHLEVFVLTTILELAVEIQSDLIQSHSITFLEILFRSALLYRFSDPKTMKTLQVILTRLNEGRLSYDLYLQLLLAHSQFAPTLHSARRPAGSFLKPVSSILKCIAIPFLDHSENNVKHKVLTTKLSKGPLEIVKLLWIILWTKARETDLDSQNEIGINLKELHALLSYSYGATLSEIDLAIYNVMKQVESLTGSCPQNVKLNSEAIEEWTRSQQRDNFPIDPDVCVSTVLFFPYDRSTSDEVPSVNKIEIDNARKKIHSSHVEVRERYDPVFILQFSIHGLSKAYIEPVEFAGSGLLAIAFVSMSSADHGIRRLAYDTLVIFKNVLEKCQKRKDVMGLRLLMNSVQNSIEESWRRIPSVIALFAAEASCVLLDSSHDHYAAICTFLTQSSTMNMKVIPLFDNFMWSSSVNFKAERSWILRLVYAGLNSDDDAMIYIRNSALESLMSFYVSPLSDAVSKDLIIEVIKKSIKVQKIARHLVKRCSLFSWLSSLISVTRRVGPNGDENRFFMKHILVVLKVVNDVISSGSMSKWLQNHGLEQLTELSSNLFSFILHDVTMTDESTELVNPFLQMIVSVLKFSQKRKICQPRFTLSIEGLYQIYQAGSVCNQATKGIYPDFALEAILMSAPPISIFLMDQERLRNFIIWAITTALASDSSQRLRSNESRIFVKKELGEESRDDSLVSKFLRWLTASVINGKLHKKSNDIYSGFTETHKLESLHSLLVHVENTSGQRHDINIGCEELLASTIFYLQLLPGINQELLPSVVSALCLLTFGASNLQVGRTILLQDYNTIISSNSLRVRCPLEANPDWRWSFYQPRKNQSLELTGTGTENMAEYHACQTLLVVVANVLGGKKLESACLSPLDVEISSLIKWERSLLRN